MKDKHLPTEVVTTWAQAKLAEPSGERCYNCKRELTVGELLNDRCRNCGAKPSEDPHAEVPF